MTWMLIVGIAFKHLHGPLCRSMRVQRRAIKLNAHALEVPFLHHVLLSKCHSGESRPASPAVKAHHNQDVSPDPDLQERAEDKQQTRSCE
jgi:hypothetical protein